MSRRFLFGVAVAAGASLAAHAATLEVRVRDAAGAPVADAALYAVPPTGGSEARGARAEIQQVDREFVPYVSVIQQGTSVTFPNRDPILHHVYSFSPAKPFEIKLYTGKSPGEILFDKAGVVTLGCNIHDWMIAYIVVVPTPYFARTDASGVALLRDIPAGSYELRAWHPTQKASPAAQTVAVDAAGTARATVAIDTATRKAKFKPPLDRLKY
jgi:plastocyanin